MQNRSVILTFALSILLLPFRALSDDADTGTMLLYDDEHTASSLKYIEESVGGGLDGGNALLLTADKWHRPVYNLYCDGGDRLNFAAFDALEFYFRSDDADTGAPTLYVKTWNQSSHTIQIADYIEGGVIDSSWRLVSIPITDLVTDDWDLGNVENLTWNTDPDGRTYFVDYIVLKTLTPPELLTEGDDAPFTESSDVIRLTFSKRYSHDSVKNLYNYAIKSETDAAYTNSTRAIDAGIHYRVDDFSDSKMAINKYQVFLKLPTALSNGHSYELQVENISDSSGNLMSAVTVPIDYDDTTLLNPNIKINQVGYLPDSPKIGYVGGFHGDLGGGAWMVGENGAILSWDDLSGWSQASSPTTVTLRDVAASSENNVWAVGDAGALIQWDGTSWTTASSPTAMDLHGLCFGPTNDGWAVGANGTILRWSGAEWTQTVSPVTLTLRSVWAAPDGTAWAVGDGGTILFWDGATWSIDEQPTTEDLYAISGPTDAALWACGANGTVLQYQYGHWTIFEDTPLTANLLRAMTTDDIGAVWISGDDGVMLYKEQFGSDPFTFIDSGTTNTIRALTRQNGRQFWGTGGNGALISNQANAWEESSLPETTILHGAFALPYGAMRLPDSATQASIIDTATGQTVLSVPLNLRYANCRLTGEDVYTFDFSSITNAGTYQAYVPGLGHSDPFAIGTDALNHAAYTTARALYYQRSGMALVEPYAESQFTRSMSHGTNTDAAYHSSLLDTPLYGGESAGFMIDGHGGWHDAGDYGKYTPTATTALWYLFTAYDIDPAKFTDNELNIPESGNGVPDLLDEAKWELDWMARIQAADGGMYHKLTAESWLGGMPDTETATRYLYEKTTHSTAMAAATFACASRIWEDIDKTVAAEYLTRAELAWTFLVAHPDSTPEDGFSNPDGTVTGDYTDSDDSNNRLWAAAELFRTTGKAEYQTYFDSWWTNTSHSWGWNTWMHCYKNAYWAYLRADHSSADTTIQAEIQESLLRKADDVVELTDTNPYHNGGRLDVPDWIGWGEFTQSCEYSFPLLQAWALTTDQTYRDAATLNLDAQLGANPLSFSFITGLGARYPLDPLHKVSSYDGVDEPVPGIPVFGVFAHMSNGQTYYAMAQSDENSYPYSDSSSDPYPILRRYIDAEELVPMSEFTIVDMAIAAGTFQILAE